MEESLIKLIENMFFQVGSIIIKYVPHTFECDLYNIKDITKVYGNKSTDIKKFKYMKFYEDDYSNPKFTRTRHTKILSTSPFPSLTELHLGSFEGSLRFISKVPNLKILRLDSLFERNLTYMSSLANLEELFLPIYYDGDLSPLIQCKKLRVLDLGSYNGDIKSLSELASLEHLIIGYCGDNIEPLGHLTNLKILRASDGYISDVTDISPLLNCTKLEKLYLPFSGISDLSPLTALTELTELRLPRVNCDISPLSNLTQLRLLYINRYTQGCVVDLKGCTLLEELCMISCTEEDMIFFRDTYPKLKKVILSYKFCRLAESTYKDMQFEIDWQ